MTQEAKIGAKRFAHETPHQLLPRPRLPPPFFNSTNGYVPHIADYQGPSSYSFTSILDDMPPLEQLPSNGLEPLRNVDSRGDDNDVPSQQTHPLEFRPAEVTRQEPWGGPGQSDVSREDVSTDFCQSHDKGRASPDQERIGLASCRSRSYSPLNALLAFPGPSSEENGQAPTREAFEQADRIVVAESLGSVTDGTDDENNASDSFDDGYSTDGFSLASTSAGPSVRDYTYENGWRYHRFREGSYNFPNDDVEQEREDMKHAMIKLLCNQKLHYAPIGNNPQRILDIGTGTGIWPIEMGDEYPSAHILGIDLSPIQPDWLPPNVRFLVDDAESPWLYPPNHFDYVHSRHMVMAIRDWTNLFHRAFEHLKPGGWIELQEVHHYPQSVHADRQVPADHAVCKFWRNVIRGLDALGVDMDVATEGRLAQMMREVGFTNVTEEVLHIPIGTWPKNRVLKTVGLYWRTILLDGLQAIGLGPLTRGLNWSRDEVELFLMDVRRGYLDDTVYMLMPLRIVCAQKPMH